MVRRKGLGVEGHALAPELEGLPVDARNDAEAVHGVTQQGHAGAGGGERLQDAADAGFDQRALGVVMVDAQKHAVCARARAAHESEAVAALHRAERRDVEHLAGAIFGAPLQAALARRWGEDVAVPFAEGVVHLGHGAAQAAVGALAQPQAHRLEHITPDARKGLQPDFAIGVENALRREQVLQPGQAVAAAVAVVGIEKAHRAKAVAGDGQQCRVARQAAHGQQQKHRAVAESMHRRAQAAVPYWATANERLVRVGRCSGGHSAGFHAAMARSAGCASTWVSRACAAA